MKSMVDVSLDEGLAALNDPVRAATLRELSFDIHEVDSEGAKQLADALLGNTTLTSLDLSYNEIGANGAEALAPALHGLTALTSLNLYDNEIGDDGAEALAPVLQGLMALTSLDLRYNEIGANGAEALAPALQGLTALTSLELYGNEIGDDTLVKFDELCTRNERLRCLFLYDARQFLLTLLSPDACGVLWPYVVGVDVNDGIEAPDDTEELQAVYAGIVEERRLYRQNASQLSSMPLIDIKVELRERGLKDSGGNKKMLVLRLATQKAAEQGDAKAQYNLGIRYTNGIGVAENQEEAVKWYQKAAEWGNVNAQYNLGLHYDSGEGVMESQEEAVKWYQKAAEQGHVNARIQQLGSMTLIDINAELRERGVKDSGGNKQALLSRLATSISSMTLTDIKAELRERELEDFGDNKQVLLTRLVDS
jgi:predicted HTH domain antitoxin